MALSKVSIALETCTGTVVYVLMETDTCWFVSSSWELTHLVQGDVILCLL